MTIHAQKNGVETLSFLVFAVHEDESIEHAKVTMSKGETESETYLLRERDYEIELKVNEFYFLLFECDGYQSKEVKVNTYVLGSADTPYLGFDVELLPSDSAAPMLDVPVALIRYDRHEGTLVPDQGYDEYVKTKHRHLKGSK